jgi:hypothetical protein
MSETASGGEACPGESRGPQAPDPDFVGMTACAQLRTSAVDPLRKRRP